MPPLYSLIDSHCHLDFPEFEGKIEALLENAKAHHVEKMVTICTKLSAYNSVKALAERYKPIYFAAGTHPHYAASEPMVSVDELIKLSTHPKYVGIGETGLDYFYTEETKSAQKESLILHIEAARQTQLPLIIHSRAADKDMAEILTSEYKNGAYKCVLHCFSSGAELARSALECDFYLSISGIATFPKSAELRDIFKLAPKNRILVETDSPYLAPVPHRGKTNEPAFVSFTAKMGADIFNMPFEEFALQTSDNFHQLFSKVPQ